MRHTRYVLPAVGLAVLALALAHAPDALAQNFGLDAAAGNSIPKTKEIATIIGRILRTALGFVGTLFLLLMVYAGFLYMTAAGDSKKVDQAKQLITGAIIGVIIIASAYAITGFVLTAATGQGGSAEVSDIPDGSVQSGGSCGSTADCVQPLICNGGVCKTTNFGSCVPGKQCSSDAECSSNGGCFDGVCSCDAI